MTQHGNVAFLGSTNTEAHGFTFRISALSVGGEDFYLEVFRNIGQPTTGKVLDAGKALLGILRLDHAGQLLACRLLGIRPDLGFDFVRRDREAGFFDFSPLEPSQLGIHGDFVARGVEASADNTFDPLNADFLHTAAGLKDAFALKLAFHLQVGQAVTGHDFEFSRFAQGNFQFIAEHGREWRKQVRVFVSKVAHADVHFPTGSVFGQIGGQLGEGVFLWCSVLLRQRKVRRQNEERKMNS